MPLSDLTPEQQQAFKDRLKELQMDPSDVVPAILPSSCKGPTILSTDPGESAIKPHMVTVSSLDEVKRIAGNPNEDYENGLMQEHHDGLPEWPQEKNTMDKSELSAEENNRIVQAEVHYLYGHSERVKSYKTIIEKHKYPAQFAVFAAEDICLDASNSPLRVTAESCHNYGTITICEGGWIDFQANVHFTVQKMVKTDAPKCPAKES